MSIQDALQRYNEVSSSLAGNYYELAKLNSAIILDWDESYSNAIAEGLAYNPATARAKTATTRWRIEVNNLQGEIDAKLIELRYLDQYLAYTKVVSNGNNVGDSEGDSNR